MTFPSQADACRDLVGIDRGAERLGHAAAHVDAQQGRVTLYTPDSFVLEQGDVIAIEAQSATGTVGRRCEVVAATAHPSNAGRHCWTAIIRSHDLPMLAQPGRPATLQMQPPPATPKTGPGIRLLWGLVILAMVEGFEYVERHFFQAEHGNLASIIWFDRIPGGRLIVLQKRIQTNTAGPGGFERLTSLRGDTGEQLASNEPDASYAGMSQSCIWFTSYNSGRVAKTVCRDPTSLDVVELEPKRAAEEAQSSKEGRAANVLLWLRRTPVRARSVGLPGRGAAHFALQFPGSSITCTGHEPSRRTFTEPAFLREPVGNSGAFVLDGPSFLLIHRLERGSLDDSLQVSRAGCDGEPRWTVPLQAQEALAAFRVDSALILVVTDRHDEAAAYSIDVETGRVRWRHAF